LGGFRGEGLRVPKKCGKRIKLTLLMGGPLEMGNLKAANGRSEKGQGHLFSNHAPQKKAEWSVGGRETVIPRPKTNGQSENPRRTFKEISKGIMKRLDGEFSSRGSRKRSAANGPPRTSQLVTPEEAKNANGNRRGARAKLLNARKPPRKKERP